MIHVYNNVNIKGEKYEIKDIIEDFLEQNKNGESRMFNVDRISSNGDKYPCKLCYESTIKEDDSLERLNGIAFCFGGIKPYYVNYCGVLANRNSLIINSSSCVTRNLIKKGFSSYNSPVLDMYAMRKFINSMKTDIDDFDRFIGRVILNNYNNCMIVDNMGVRISHNDLAQSLMEIEPINTKITKLDAYLAVSSKISEKRINGKDMNWFMYKILLLNKIIQ